MTQQNPKGNEPTNLHVPSWICRRCGTENPGYKPTCTGSLDGKPCYEPRVKRPDEDWIRDLNAHDLMVEINSHESATQACEGLKTHCSYCGAEFPLWPPKEVMGHAQIEHAKDLTLQQLNACAALCDSDWTMHHVQYFSSFVLTYVPLRRRLRDLGLIVFTDPELSRSGKVLGPDGRRVQ